jgi:signal transduction histidine kinase
MSERRGVYFAFQGLFIAVVLLIFQYQYHDRAEWLVVFSFLLLFSGTTLLALRLAPMEMLRHSWFATSLFLSDAALASLLLRWTQPQSELYLIYFLIIFGTAITRNLQQSFAVAVVTALLYLASSWRPETGFTHETVYWLRFLFLIISAALMGILSLDSQQAQAEQERKYRDRLIQSERLATLGRVAGEVAHQIKGPLTTIMVNADVLAARHSKSKGILKELAEIREEVDHCKHILKNLLDLGRIEAVEFVRIDLRHPVRLALKSVEPQLRQKGVKFAVSGMQKPCRILADPSLIQEAVAAVLQNAVEASRPGGDIRISLAPEARPVWIRTGAGAMRLVIEDNGAGMEEKDLERIFEPFFTTKGAEGTGLGLSAALRILQKHGGSIDAYSLGPGFGARFTLSIPVEAGAV